MPTVFISHSSEGDPFAAAVLDRLQSLMKTKNFEVLVNLTSLRPGHDWERDIERWLDSCDAAVVLLNAKALQSEWVRHEVSVLMHRKHMYRQGNRPELFLIPVLLGGVQARDVRSAGLKRLAKLTQFQDGSAEIDASVVAEQIAENFTTTLVDGSNNDAMGEWIQRIAYQISQVGHDSRLIAAARALEIGDDEVSNVRLWGGSRFLAERLMKSRLCRHTIDAVAKLTPFMSAEHCRTLVEEIKPTWVDGEAAELILHTSPTDRLVALLNARWYETGMEYFARATCRARSGYWSTVVGIVPGAQPAAELLTACLNALEGSFIVDPQHALSEKAPSGRCFLVIDPNGIRLDVVAETIREINKRFPWLGILLLTGESLPDGATVSAWQLSNTVALQPALRESAEFTARRMVKELTALVTQS